MDKTIPVLYENKFSYNVIIEFNFDNLIENINSIKSEKYDKICVFTDDNVSNLYLDKIVKILNDEYNVVITFVLPHGEENKQLHHIEKLYELLIGNHFTRKDLLIALGGGVVGDMCGFAAATYLRGIDFIQIPTTLLSQVDSSIGGKTGVDYMAYKNMIGAFYMPKLVYINLNTLKSLSIEQMACGMGEVIKYGLIMDSSFYYWLSSVDGGLSGLSDDDIFRIVHTCILCKKKVVEEDPREKGVRSYLNFGHTIGHAIEKLSGFRLYHGQCVAIGMVAAMYLSAYPDGMSDIKESDIAGCIDILTKYELPSTVPHEISSGFNAYDIVSAMKSDKKADSGKIKFIILREIGKAAPYIDFSDDDFIRALSTIMP